MKKPATIFSRLFPAVLLIVGAGCGEPSAPGEERAGSAASEIEQLRFDPLDMKADRTIVPKEYPRSGAINGTVLIDEEAQLPPPDSTVSYLPVVADQIDSLLSQAYRIQIFTTKVYGEAQRALRVAEEIFDRSVSVDYEVPYFKVRAGRFAVREDAMKYAQRAKAAGYKDAWVVMVNTNIRKAPSLYDEEFPVFQFRESLNQQEPDGGEESDEDSDD